LATVEAYDPATNTWTTKASMPTARTGLGVAAINGVLYAVGGDVGCCYQPSNMVATVEAYDPATNTWTTKASMPTARAELGVGVVNGILYAVDGAYNPGIYGVTYVVATVEAYDPATNTWTTKASDPTARYGPGVDAINGRLYAAGGFQYTGGGTYFNTVDVYHP
jgi:N-acetylneuraminic acid mutarotase